MSKIEFFSKVQQDEVQEDMMLGLLADTIMFYGKILEAALVHGDYPKPLVRVVEIDGAKLRCFSIKPHDEFSESHPEIIEILEACGFSVLPELNQQNYYPDHRSAPLVASTEGGDGEITDHGDGIITVVT